MYAKSELWEGHWEHHEHGCEGCVREQQQPKAGGKWLGSPAVSPIGLELLRAAHVSHALRPAAQARRRAPHQHAR